MTILASSPTGFKPPFNYGDICESLQNEAESLVDGIRISLIKFNLEALELARRINQLREQLSAKQFRDWLAYYFPDAEKTIRNWLKIVDLAERVPEQVESMMGWATGAIIALSRASDELVKTILSSSQKLTIKQINDLIAEEQGKQKLSASTSTPKLAVQPNQVTIELAKLAANLVNLKAQLNEAVTAQAQEQLMVDINQTEKRIKQLCQDFDPKSVTITPGQSTSTYLQSSPKSQTVNVGSENSENSELQLQKLQSQLRVEQQSNLKLQEQIQQLEQRLTELTESTPQNNNSDHPNELEKLQSQLETDSQQTELESKSIELTESIESHQIEQLQRQLKEREEYIAYLHQQDSEANDNNAVFKPVFIAARLKELKLNDRIRVISPEKDGQATVIDDLVVGFDRDDHPKTKWSGTLSEQDEASGYRFERMIGTERAQSQLTQLKHQNRQLQERIAEIEDLDNNNVSKKEEYQLELELRGVQNQLREKENIFEELMQWRDLLQTQIQKQLRSGVEVEILLDPKRVVTGMRGIVDHEFECSPGQWWVKFINPKTQESFNRLFPAYQLYIVNSER
ncbi:hypothetical protein [Lyngbya sp. PCC 8106]|uniref:hypothetical protein n=1 Tax=Lyngbya sp. (strain PCC 8106) TaxID=313612 RepID=UPI0000EAB5EE|nr:hypothetical protein [Lyngbya sp. PCC 8106]EAW35964.1 hypothetical protein L8106_22251 [Lyngbya sp. PCC 8106]